MEGFIIAMGVPSAIMGIIAWWMKRAMEKRDKKAEEREQNMEQIMMMIMKNGRATYILADATARAVQRIPDAHCNGDMTSALEEADRVQKEEQQFLMDQGVKHVFDR